MVNKSKPIPRFRFTPVQETDAQLVRTTPDPIESYADRTGYAADFIDAANPVTLPRLGEAAKRDTVTFTWKGATTHVLNYTHFSTAVSKSRRMPIFSACNIDGTKVQTINRGDIWKFDPRIPLEFQILTEVYGNERDGYFSRGHMTRRKDPDWGSKAEATLADADTFHATNAAPQVQHFNAGLWGAIEDYILSNTQSDHMRVNVFTGPVFASDDPMVRGIKIPVRFWKVVAFLHDETGQLTATGYVASQANAVGERNKTFVFGDFENQQRPLAAIEKLVGLSFGKLTARDVLAAAGEGFAASLRDVRDIMLA